MLIAYILGFVITYLLLWWIVGENEASEHKFYFLASTLWIVFVPLFIVISIISFITVLNEEV